MKIITMTRLLGAMLLLTLLPSCVGGKDQLEYDNSPCKEYLFGNNDELSVQLPVPVTGYPSDLYSNFIRREWINTGFTDYYPISDIRITKEKDDNKIITIRLNSTSLNDFIISRELCILTKDIPIRLTIGTGMHEKPKYSKATIDRFVAEDNDLFEKILKTVRVKGANGKLLGIKVDYDAIKKKTQEIYSAPNRPSATFEMNYELVEMPPVPPRESNAAPAEQKD